MQNHTINQAIENKINQANQNLAYSYSLYLNDIESVKLMLPESERYTLNELTATIDRTQEQITGIYRRHLRPFVTTHIRTLLAQEQLDAEKSPCALSATKDGEA